MAQILNTFKKQQPWMRLSLPFFFIVSLLGLAHSLVVIDSALASSCIYYMKNFEWGCGGTGQGHAMYKCRCASIEWLGSVSNCISTKGDESGQIEHALAHVTKRCAQKAHLFFTVDDMVGFSENATQFLEYPTAKDLKVQVYHPLSVNETAFEVYDRSFKQMNHHVFKTQWFGWGLVFFWALFVALYTVANINQKYFRVALFGKKTSQWCQKTFMPVTPIFGLTRLNILIMSLFTVQTVLSTALSYTVELPNMYINDVYFLTLDLIGYRSGIIAFSLLPVVYIFGVRNNPFCYLTGLPSCEFIKYHKFVALIMSLEALVHSAVWTAYAIRSGGYMSWSIDVYWRWGIVGTVIIFVMIGQSLRIVRTYMYEAFLVLHKVLSWLFIVAMWYHCDILGWMGWVYAMIAITVFDRVVRFFKIYFVNRGFTEVRVKIVDDSVLKISIPKPLLFHAVYRPGTHLYLSFFHWPMWYNCFQSHPFTLISSPVEYDGSMTVYVRVKKGVTRTLSNLKTDDKGTVAMWSLIDGPYGGGAGNYAENDQLVGITGGIGICSVLHHFYEKPQNSKLLWAVNNMADVLSLRSDLEFLIRKGTEVTVFYNSKADEDDILIEKSLDYVRVVSNRQNVDEWVAEAITSAKNQNKTDLFVVSCGPGSMDKDVNDSILKRVEVGLPLSVHHKLENFQW